MYALIFSGLIIANGSAVLFGTDTMSPGFIMGGFVAVIGIVFGFLTVRCPHCGKLLNLKGLKKLIKPLIVSPLRNLPDKKTIVSTSKKPAKPFGQC